MITSFFESILLKKAAPLDVSFQPRLWEHTNLASVMQSSEKSVPNPSGTEKNLEKSIEQSLQVLSFREHKISSMSKNGERYYNATEMAKAYGEKPISFLRSPNTQRFINALGESIFKNAEVQKTHFGNTDDYAFFTQKGGDSYGGATWMHEKLALKFAAWLDVDFELWMLDTMWKLMRGELSPQKKGLDIGIFEQVETKQELNGHTYYKVKELWKLVGRKRSVSVKRLRKAYGACVVKVDDALYITKAAFVLFMKRSEIATQMYESRKELPKLASGQYEIFTPSQLNP